MSLVNKLVDVFSVEPHVLKSTSGLSQREINILRQLELIELHKHRTKTRKTPAHPNCLVLTLLGKRFVDLVENNTISTKQVVKKVGRTLEETTSKFQEIISMLQGIGQSLDGIENLLQMITEMREEPLSGLEDNQIILLLGTAELVASADMRDGPYTAIEMYFKVLESIGMGSDEIQEYLRKLYESGKLEFPNGITTKTVPRNTRFVEVENGEKYVWGRLTVS